MSARTAASRNTRSLDLSTPQLDARIAAAERDAVIVWRGERIPFVEVAARIAATDGRHERDGLYAGWIEALEALNPLYAERLASWRERAAGSEDLAAAFGVGLDLEAFTLELQRLAIQSETVYHAALRRYLALIDIEHGDATLADLWHVMRGAAWSHWFGERELVRAAAEAGRDATAVRHAGGWPAAEAGLIGEPLEPGTPGAAIGELYGSLVGDPSWLARGLRMAGDEIASFADFVAFVRLWRLRRGLATVQYEMRLYRTDEEAIQRAYYAGIVGHMTGVAMPEAAYLRDVERPFVSVRDVQQSLLVGAIAERLENRYGSAWWANEAARAWTGELAGASSTPDVLAQLGYDAPDWRPVLRQIRTRLIGEMSGYGGPNITTRAGTRKV